MCIKTAVKDTLTLKRVAEMTSRQINRRIMFCLAIIGVCVHALAALADTSILTTAERMDKMGSVGVLSLCLIASLAITYRLINLQYTKMMDIIDKNTEAHMRMSASIEKFEDRLKRADRGNCPLE